MRDWSTYAREQLGELGVSPAREAEIVAEIAQQLEQAYNAALARGASPAQAEAVATAQFPDWRALARDIRASGEPRLPIEDRKPSIFSGMLQDFRHAARLLRGNLAFALLAICTLAFGIGANSAIFTIVDALALKPLPYNDPARLVAIGGVDRVSSAYWTSMLDFIDLENSARSFSTMASISPVWSDVVTLHSTAQRVQSLYVSASFFPMLGVNAIAGRVFTPAEDKYSAGSKLVMLSYAYWQREFGGDRGIIGQALNVNGNAFTIAGVLPRDFRYLGEPIAGTPDTVDLWFPSSTNQIANSVRAVRYLKVIAKLKPGVTLDQAQAELTALSATFHQRYPDVDSAIDFRAQPLAEQVSGKIRPAMLLLLGAVMFVLLMACANVANLLLTVAISRGKEIAVRAALGASRFRLIRQFLAESILLAGLGTLAGIAIGVAILRGLLAVAPASLLEGRIIALDRRAMLFTISVAAASALLSGLPPAWRVLRGDVGAGLRESSRGFTGSHRRFRAALVVAQISLALALLIGSGLLIRSFARLLNVNPGFQPQRVATVTTLLPSSVIRAQQALPMDQAIIDRLAQIPGVTAAGAVSRLPMLGGNLGTWISMEGKPVLPGQQPSVEYRTASNNYFAAMGIPLAAGRFFDDRDAANPSGVTIVNETAAREFWPGENPVGRRVRFGANPEKQNWVTVIGVIGDVHQFGLDLPPTPEAYRPLIAGALFNPILVARVEGDPATALPAMAAAAHSVSGDLPVYNAFPMSALVARSAAQRRFLMLLLSGFAACALLLAAVGIYGTISQLVAQRTRELGLRMALGASQGNVLGMILKEGFGMALLGVLLGGLAAGGLTRLMTSTLFEVKPLDATVFAGAAAALCLVSIAACLVPAFRATRVDPLIALRHEE